MLRHNPNPFLRTAAYLLILSVGGVPGDDNPKDKLGFSLFLIRGYSYYFVFCSSYPEPKKKTVVGKESRKKRSSGKVSMNEYFWITFPLWLREAVHNLVFKLPTETFPFLLFSSCSSRTHQSEEAFVLTKIFASSLIIRDMSPRCIVVK